jgi:hypothetical protein
MVLLMMALYAEINVLSQETVISVLIVNPRFLL